MRCNACGALSAVSSADTLLPTVRQVRYCYVCGALLHVDSQVCVEDITAPQGNLLSPKPVDIFSFGVTRASLHRRLIARGYGAFVYCTPKNLQAEGEYSDMSLLGKKEHSMNSSHCNGTHVPPLDGWPMHVLNEEDAKKMIAVQSENVLCTSTPQVFVRLGDVESVLADVVSDFNSRLASMYVNSTDVKVESYDYNAREVTLEKRVKELERELRQHKEEHRREVAAIHQQYKDSRQWTQELDEAEKGDIKAAYLLLRKTLIPPMNNENLMRL